MKDEIRKQAKAVQDYRLFVAQERFKMQQDKLNPRIFESYERQLAKMERYLCDLVIIAIERGEWS